MKEKRGGGGIIVGRFFEARLTGKMEERGFVCANERESGRRKGELGREKRENRWLYRERN